MKILIQFPTRGRYYLFNEVLHSYFELLGDPENVLFHIVLDDDDPTMTETLIGNLFATQGAFYGKKVPYVVTRRPHDSKIHAVNDLDLVMKEDWDVIFLASDDMFPEADSYDGEIRFHMQENFPDLDGVLHYNDGHQGSNLNTLCILGRRYYERFGYIYYPEYKSLFADNEFTDVSRLLGRTRYYDYVIVRHRHPDADKSMKYDDLYKKNDEWLHHDHTVYNTRRQMNFGLTRDDQGRWTTERSE